MQKPFIFLPMLSIKNKHNTQHQTSIYFRLCFSLYVPSSSKLTVPNGNGKTNLDANQTENATEDTRMLVNVIVSAPQDYNNGDVNA